MQYGLSTDTIQKICGVFAAFPAVEKAVLYGSRAKGNYKTGSDIDLTLYGEHFTPDLLGDITEALDDLLLPYKIDLSLFDELDHAKLREHIERVGVQFYLRTEKPPPGRSDWRIKRLGDICKTSAGGTPLTSKKEYYEQGTIPWLQSGEVNQGEIFSAKNFITPLGLENSSAKLFPKNTVLIAMYGANAGEVGILRSEASTNQAVCGILPSDYFEPKFLYYLFLSKYDELASQAVGNAQPNISQAKIKDTLVPLVSIPEQQRIVATLDEAFAGIATATENAQKNLQNARELFESHLQSIFSTKGKGWVETTVGEQITLQRGFDITKDQQTHGHVPVVSSGGIKSFHDTSMVNAPGVVIGRKGTLGKVFYMDNNFWPHDTTLWVKEFNGNHPKLVYYFFKYLDVSHLDSGAANPALNRNQVHPLKISWPPRSQHNALVAAIIELENKTKHLETIYQQKLEHLAALKQSILQKAFAGELHTDRLAA